MRILKTLSVFSICLFVVLDAIAQTEYSNAVTFVSQTDEVLTVQSIGLSEKKKTAPEMAVRSAFYTLLYRGISGYNNGKPLVTNDNKYYTDKLLTLRYNMFVRSKRELTAPEKDVSGDYYKSQVEIEILIKSLVKDMVFEKVMDNPLSEVTMEDTKAEIGLPSITVIPYKKDDESYKQILQEDFDRRIAVSRVQNGFNQLGVTTIDFEGRMEAVWRSQDFNASAAESDESRLLQSTGSDVNVIVDIKKDISAQEGSRISLVMKAYETASGNILASRQDWTNRFHTNNLDQLCIYAVDAQLKGFLDDIALNFARSIKSGTSVMLKISRTPESTTNLNSTVGDAGYQLSNAIRRWVRSNAQDGRYHLQGVVADEMIFDDIKIPSKDVDGLPMDAAQFGDNLLYYLNNTLKVKCQLKLDGRTIYITLQ